MGLRLLLAMVVVALGLSIGHGLWCAARGCGCAATAAPGLSAGHGPLRAAHGHGPAAAVGLRWTCGPYSSASGTGSNSVSQSGDPKPLKWRFEEKSFLKKKGVKRRSGNLHLRLSPTK